MSNKNVTSNTIFWHSILCPFTLDNPFRSQVLAPFLIGHNTPPANLRDFLKLTFQTQWVIPCERARKTVPENGARIFTSLFEVLLPIERCETKQFVL